MAKSVVIAQFYKKEKPSDVIKTRKEVICDEFKSFRIKGAQIDSCYELLDLLLKNIIEKEPSDLGQDANQQEENKCRTLKQTNKKLCDLVTKHTPGQNLMIHIGFKKEGSGSEAVWHNTSKISWIKGVRLDLQAGYHNYQTESGK